MLNTTCTNSMTYNSLISSKLKLPFAGIRNWSNGYYYYQTSYAFYWSSSPWITNAYDLYFDAVNIFTTSGDYRSDGFSVRCIKN